MQYRNRFLSAWTCIAAALVISCGGDDDHAGADGGVDCAAIMEGQDS